MIIIYGPLIIFYLVIATIIFINDRIKGELLPFRVGVLGIIFWPIILLWICITSISSNRNE